MNFEKYKNLVESLNKDVSSADSLKIDHLKYKLQDLEDELRMREEHNEMYSYKSMSNEEIKDMINEIEEELKGLTEDSCYTEEEMDINEGHEIPVLPLEIHHQEEIDCINDILCKAEELKNCTLLCDCKHLKKLLKAAIKLRDYAIKVHTHHVEVEEPVIVEDEVEYDFSDVNLVLKKVIDELLDENKNKIGRVGLLYKLKDIDNLYHMYLAITDLRTYADEDIESVLNQLLARAADALNCSEEELMNYLSGE